MGDSTLATFRVEQALWDEFKLHCSQNGDSASSRIIKLILADMGKSEDLTPLDSDIDKRIESYLESHLDRFIDKVSRTDIDKDSIQRLDSRIDHKVNDAIATSLTPITEKLSYLSRRIDSIQLSPPEEKQPLESFTPDNDDSPIEKKIDGQSNNKTDKNTEKGLLGKELAAKIGLFRKDGQPADDILSKWVKSREEGRTSIKGKNSSIYAEFLKWEKIGDRWFRMD